MIYQWYESCSPGWKQKDDTFKFYLKKGIAGKCPGDNMPLEGKFKFKERQEVMSDMLDEGTYLWSADVETISDKLVHAEYFSLFQIHDQRDEGRPPHCIQVRNGNIVLISPNKADHYVKEYNGKLNIYTTIHINKRNVIVDYTIDGKNVGKINADTIGQSFVKFGAYRWNAVSNVKQIYRKVRFERIDVS